jgi:hypothetical protein
MPPRSLALSLPSGLAAAVSKQAIEAIEALFS